MNIRNTQKGFTLVEILIVILIMVALGTIGGMRLLRTERATAFDVARDRIVAEVRGTMARSRAQENGEQWGMHFENPVGAKDFFEVWSGSDYATGTKKPPVYLEDGIVFSDDLAVEGSSKDIVFAKITGLPAAAETITIQSEGTSTEVTITISTYGKIEF
jgi:prepilin-type N-terminal cleavage/methylation domain-containing protein